ncbi:MAG: hypothetical protein ACJ79W_00090, partial [Myxococcales bacterium]
MAGGPERAAAVSTPREDQGAVRPGARPREAAPKAGAAVLRAGGLRAEAARKDEALQRPAAAHQEGAAPWVGVRRAASRPAGVALRPVSPDLRQR